MKLLLVPIIVMLAWVGAFVVPAYADHCILFGCDDSEFGLYDAYNQSIQNLRRTGEHPWLYVQDATGQDIHAAVSQGYAEYEQEFGIDTYEGTDGVKVFASGGTQYVYGNREHRGCAQWSIGCLPEFLTNQHIVLESSQMVLWPFRSQVEVVLHEIGHQLGNFAEQYRESYVYGSTQCTSKSYTVMDCGLFNAQFLGQFERDAWALSHAVDTPAIQCCEFNGQWYFWYCGPTDPKGFGDIELRAMDRNSKVSRYVDHIPSPIGTQCRGWHPEGFGPNEIPCINYGNAISWQRSFMRDDQCATQWVTP